MTDTATGLAPLFRGNSFLLVLFSAVKKGFGAASEMGKSANGLTRTALFSALIKILNSHYEPKSDNDRFAPYISKYLNGDLICSRSYYPFDSEEFQEEVEKSFTSQYDAALSAMNAFCYKYLDMPSEANGNNSKAIKRLVAGIIDIMLLDKTFDEEINTGYRTVKKKALDRETEFILQPFLLDVWYKILTKYSGEIDSGKINKMETKKKAWKETYKELTNSDGNKRPRKLKPEIGRERADKIEVSVTLMKPQDTLCCNRNVEDYNSAIESTETVKEMQSYDMKSTKASVMNATLVTAKEGGEIMQKNDNDVENKDNNEEKKYWRDEDGDLIIAKNYIKSVQGSTLNFS
ncbi:MAG: hypothetical protein IJQ99_02800 [Synergistaceae bacterium]|nr:hypothetical protein [Synergistaceae bacterium]